MRRVSLALALTALPLAACGILLLASVMRGLPHLALSHSWGGIESYQPAPDSRAARASFPYSVVPGGVMSADEVEATVARDPVVAQHYRGILLTHLYAMRLNAAIDAYASYRANDEVRWTAHPIRIPKGELVLSDGANLIRGRCGNRLRFAPPVEERWPGQPPPIEPPAIVFSHGMPPILGPPEMPAGPSGASPQPAPAAAHFWPPMILPPVWCCATGGFPGSWPGPQPAPPPSAIPEPLSALLLLTGLLITLASTGKLWRRKS